MGMGCACIRPEPEHQSPGDSSICFIAFKQDMSDFEEKIDYYLIHDREREDIAKAGQRYYDEYLSPEAQAKYILNRAERHR